MYDVDQYTDEELYSILDVFSPTDSELEARILQLIQRHMYLQNEDSNKLVSFFNDIYKRFFDTEENNNDNNNNNNNDNNHDNDNKSQVQDQNSSGTTPNIEYSKEISYTKGKVNPILKETYRRTITVDSQYRDSEYKMSTDFTLNFTETLKDVVSLKLYAVQIPVTWYTISNNYGSNYFFLRPRLIETGDYNTIAIYNKPEHQYKIEVEPGNYTPVSLISEINNSISQLNHIYFDISFGTSSAQYSTTNAKCQLTIDLQKHYSEICYDISFSGNLSQLLGFDSYLNTGCVKSQLITNINDDVIISSQNNTIVFTHYTDSSLSSEIEQFTLVIPPNVYKTSNDIESDQFINAVNGSILYNQKLLPSSSFTRNSFVQTIGSTTITYYYFIFQFHIDRNTTSNIIDSKWTVTFPFTNNDGSITAWQNLQFSEINQLSLIQGTTITTTDIITPKGSIVFRPISQYNGIFIENSNLNDITIQYDSDISFNYTDFLSDFNTKFNSNPLLFGTSFSLDSNIISLSLNINKIYTTNEYEIVFYDITSFSKCVKGSNSYRNAMIDTTLGYILGFKSFTTYEFSPLKVVYDDNKSYYLNESTGLSSGNEFTINYVNTDDTNSRRSHTIAKIKGNSVVSVYLYNYFMIILDDFNQNHLNDGLVTVSKRDNSVTLPSYANRKLFRNCNNSYSTELQTNILPKLTQKQVYSVEEILKTQTEQKSNLHDGPFIKDMFALLPVKSSNATPGTIYVEFGGSLQQQERIYFGPVNIRRLSIKLINDKGDIIDLNGADWSFQFVCEQLYQNT